jgi:NitT/TauT family transport system substrate-binding protein
MDFFIQRQTEAASAMTYNELAQVLESRNPRTGKLFKLRDLHVFKMEKLGTGMLEDGIFVRGDWIKSKANQGIAKRFVAATLKGWIYCRNHYIDCANISVRNGTRLPRGHQRWMMNEINALIWPTKRPVGVMDPAAFRRTARIALQFKAVTHPVSKAAYRTDIARAAIKMLRRQKLDVYGKGWKKAAVRVTPGGR